MGKFVSQNNLAYIWSKIKTLLGNKADKSEVNAKLTGTKYNASNPNVFCGYNAENNDNAEYMMAFKNNNNVYGFCHSQFANIKTSAKKPSECTYNGFFYVSSTTNSLSGADANPFLQYHTSQADFRILTTAYSDIWLQQIATDFRSEHVYVRRKENGTWSAWTKFAKSGDIPTNNNQLTNGAGFITSSALGTQCTFSLSGTTLTITPK